MKADRRQHFDGIYDRIEVANCKGYHRQVFRTLEKLSSKRQTAPYMSAVKDTNGKVICVDDGKLEM